MYPNLSLPRSFYLFNLPERWAAAAGVAELWSRSTPTGMRIVSDVWAAPLASFCHSKLLIVGEAERERQQTVCCEKQAFFYGDERESAQSQECI